MPQCLKVNGLGAANAVRNAFGACYAGRQIRPGDVRAAREKVTEADEAHFMREKE